MCTAVVDSSSHASAAGFPLLEPPRRQPLSPGQTQVVARPRKEPQQGSDCERSDEEKVGSVGARSHEAPFSCVSFWRTALFALYVRVIINTSYQKLPFGSGDYPDKCDRRVTSFDHDPTSTYPGALG